MNKVTQVVAAAAVLAGLATSASAATFDLTDANRYSSTSFSITGDDGLTMTVSGGEYDGASQRVSAHKDFGLSVGDVYVDTNEFALFEFSKKVNLTSFLAGFVDKYDGYRVYAKVGEVFNLIASGGFGVTNATGKNGDRATVMLGDASVASMSFAIGVANVWDEFKIRSLTVDPVSEVPLPAGGVLLLSAFGLVAIKRRKAA